MRNLTALVCVLLVFGLTAFVFGRGLRSGAEDGRRTPILVELFTSEGCSSCPPADRLLQKLDQQPIAGAELIVLSEHVDYWNHIGWKDPYSDHLYSERQTVYGKRFGLASVYTPQMVIDGASELVGSNSSLADKALGKALKTAKLSLHLSSITVSPIFLRAHLEMEGLDPFDRDQEAEVYAAVALNHAESRVLSGENAGHKLEHAAVVRGITKVGSVKPGQGWSQEIELKLEPGADPSNLRLIAFAQEPQQGRVLGAAAARVAPK